MKKNNIIIFSEYFMRRRIIYEGKIYNNAGSKVTSVINATVNVIAEIIPNWDVGIKLETVNSETKKIKDKGQIKKFSYDFEKKIKEIKNKEIRKSLSNLLNSMKNA